MSVSKKICLLGSVSVGKTSLIRRFVKGIFSDKYLTTVGVKIDKKVVEAASREVTLILWDLAGEDEFAQLQTSYLRGTAGYLLVVDGTRPETLDKVIELQLRAHNAVGEVPFILALNKADLREDWAVLEDRIEQLRARGWTVREASAKSGDGVDEIFTLLTERLMP